MARVRRRCSVQPMTGLVLAVLQPSKTLTGGTLTSVPVAKDGTEKCDTSLVRFGLIDGETHLDISARRIEHWPGGLSIVIVADASAGWTDSMC